MRVPLVTLTLFALLLAPLASAGTQDAPELLDVAGDCEYVAGNEYADILSAWISDETATDFLVNMAIQKWSDAAGLGAGFTVQFVHQGVQFGIVGAYEGTGTWYYGNGLVEGTDVGELEDAEGSFTPGTPSILTVKFAKSHFPHGDMSDNTLRNFHAGSADLKAWIPWLASPVDMPAPPPEPVLCDEAESDAVYEFQVGGHSMGDMSAPNPTDASGTTENTTVEPAGSSGTTTTTASNDTPGFTPILLAAALVAVALLLRRR